MHEVLLYYKYIKIENPVQLMKQQRKICVDLNLKGRILISEEGINGTVEGTKENTKRYEQAMLSSELFSDLRIKRSDSDGNAFKKLKVKVRSEIVTSGLDKSPSVTGKYLTADELHSWFESGREFYIVDMRNDYEQKAGVFEGSILPGFANFRDLPSVVQKISHLKDKTIVSVCTGGVRCEKASGFLVENGFSNVYQLMDGIHTYMEKYPNQHFKGKLYVFDERILVGFNTHDPKHEIIGRCEKCGNLSENYVNCANDECHLHFICCHNCLINDKAFCKEECVHAERAISFQN